MQDRGIASEEIQQVDSSPTKTQFHVFSRQIDKNGRLAIFQCSPCHHGFSETITAVNATDFEVLTPSTTNSGIRSDKNRLQP